MLSLIATLIFIMFVAVFAGFNLNTRCDINLIFRTFTDVPVFLALIIAFVSGAIVTLPYVFFKRAQRKPKAPKPEKIPKEQKKKKGKDAHAKVEPVDGGGQVVPGEVVLPEAAAGLSEIDDNSFRMQ